MKTKIKTARERSNEFCESRPMQVIPWDIRRSLERTLAREFDNHARRAHERHARKNVCFVGGKLDHVFPSYSGGWFATVKLAKKPTK